MGTLMLGFQPHIKLLHNWNQLISRVTDVAHSFVINKQYQDHILYESGASVVAELPNGGWISKSGPSQDFFVLGGIPETELLDKFFNHTFPELTFTPATICWSSSNVPRHRDSIKNGQCSFVYPMHDNSGTGVVYEPDSNQVYTYETQADTPIIINITKEHEVKITDPRIWFSIHMHEDIEKVKKVFDNLPKYQYTIE
jgi:hypothetical protein